MVTTKFNVKGMSCHHCVMAIQKAVKPIEGVESIDVSLQKGEVSITYEPSKLDITKVKEKIIEEGYEVQS